MGRTEVLGGAPRAPLTIRSTILTKKARAMNIALVHSIERFARCVVPALPLLLAPTADARPSSPSEPSDTSLDSAWGAEISGAIRHTEYEFQPIAEESGVWSAPNRSQELRSRVSARGLEVFPRSTGADGHAAPWKLELRTASFGRLGGDRELAPATMAVRENRVELDHGPILEWLENRLGGIEQGWTIETRPSGAGPLRIGLEVAGDLCFAVDATACSGELVDEHGELRLHYRDLLVFDASGRELSARLEPSAAGLVILVDDSAATYPITVDPVLEGPVWTHEGDQTDANFGHSVASAGDVNGDGFDDVIVGVSKFDAGQLDEGRALLYLGSAAGLATLHAWWIDGDQQDALLGHSVASAGDVNGDGFDDVLVGGPGRSNPEPQEGRAWLFMGSAAGLSALPAWWDYSNQDYALYGFCVASAGDVNADGFDDVIISAPYFDYPEIDEGHVWLYLGSPGGLGHSVWTIGGDQDTSFFGYSVASAGDVDGDGFDDVIIGGPGRSNPETDEGRAWVFHGSASGLETDPTWYDQSDQNSAWFGYSVAGAGDVNADGFDDVLVGAPYHDSGNLNEGRVCLYLGSPGGLGSAVWIDDTDQDSAFYGWSVAGAGDVNRDGYDDVITASPAYDIAHTNEGAAWLFPGSAAGLTGTGWGAAGHQIGAWFGFSVASAGDVDGDGASDVIVGAPFHDSGQSNEGMAYVYLGRGNPGEKYCVANPNSTGAPADITAFGTTSSSAGELTLEASPVPNQTGLFFHGMNQTQIPYGNGFLCASGDVVRGEVITAAGNRATYSYDNSGPKHRLGAYVGSTRNFQYWFRDPMHGGALFNTSNAISITIFP